MKDAQPARNGLVIKSNALVNAMFEMGLQANRFLAFAISCLDRSVEPMKGQPLEIEIDVPGFAESFEISSKNAYREVENLADQLQRKIIQIEGMPGERIKIGIINKQKYHDGEGRVWLRFDEDLVPHLLGLREKFTKYMIKDVYQFQRAGTWRVYELLKQYKDIGKREFEIEEFKMKVGSGGLYQNLGDFKKRIITPAIKEINEVSDILVALDQTKRGRRVVKLVFHIKDNLDTKSRIEKIRHAVDNNPNLGPVKNPEFAKRLREDFRVSPKRADQLAKLWQGEEAKAEKILARIAAKHKRGGIQSLGGAVFKALRDEGVQFGLE
jgi:plasmid replication initiation protein